MDRATRIIDCLTLAFAPQQLQLIDESHLHAGHAGALTGKGHYRVHITAEAFNGRSALDRHRLVYGALGDLMQTDIHALAIKAKGTRDSTS